MELGAQYEHNLFPNKLRKCKRRFDQNEDPNGYRLPAKITVTDHEMSSRLHGLSLDQIDISHYLLYPHLQPTHHYTVPDNIIHPATRTETISQEHISEDELSDDEVVEETDYLLTMEKLKLAHSKTTEILPREIINSILSSTSHTCTTLALWKPIDHVLHLTEPSAESEDLITAEPEPANDIERASEEVMEIDSIL